MLVVNRDVYSIMYCKDSGSLTYCEAANIEQCTYVMANTIYVA